MYGYEGHMWWMGLWWIAGLALLFVVVRWAVSTRGSSQGGSPEQVLKKRYARGEMERDEYLRRLEELRR